MWEYSVGCEQVCEVLYFEGESQARTATPRQVVSKFSKDYIPAMALPTFKIIYYSHAIKHIKIFLNIINLCKVFTVSDYLEHIV